MDEKNSIAPHGNTDKIGKPTKVWEAGYFKRIYDNDGDEYVHGKQLNRLGLSVVNGKLCCTYKKE